MISRGSKPPVRERRASSLVVLLLPNSFGGRKLCWWNSRRAVSVLEGELKAERKEESRRPAGVEGRWIVDMSKCRRQ